MLWHNWLFYSVFISFLFHWPLKFYDIVSLALWLWIACNKRLRVYYYSWKASSSQLAAAEEYVLVGVTTPSDLQQTGPWVPDSNILEGCPSLVTLDWHKHCVLFDNTAKAQPKSNFGKSDYTQGLYTSRIPTESFNLTGPFSRPCTSLICCFLAHPCKLFITPHLRR